MTRKVLLIGVFPQPVGGVSIHLQRLAAHLEKRGIPCARLDESRIPKAEIPNIRVIGIARYLRMIASAEIVHIHTSHGLARCFHVVCAKLLGRKVVLTVHSLTATSKSRLVRWMYQWTSAVADTTIYVSERVRRELTGSGPVIPAFLQPSKMEQVAPPEIESWVAERRREGCKVIVSNASRLNFFRGQDLYGLDLLIGAIIADAALACVFVVSSLQEGADHFAACQDRIVRYGLTNRFLLLQQETPFAGIIRLGDAMVRATNTDGDALSVREALWLGKPVVASDCADRPAGVTLFSTRNLDSLSAALRALDPQRVSPNKDDYGDAIINAYAP